MAYSPAATLVKTYDPDYDGYPSAYPQYSFGYDVQDSITGDFKHQQESRDGDVVHGSYSLLESDGTKRIVDYTADSINGFNAVVRKEGFAAPVPYAAVPTYNYYPYNVHPTFYHH